MFLGLIGFCDQLFAQKSTDKNSSGNPIFPGWYADPEAAVFNRQYWVYPTFSAPYEPLGETDANHRVTCIDKMFFDEQGLIKPVEITKDGVVARRL